MSTTLLGGPLAQAIGLALLHALWQGAIVAGALTAVLALLTRRSASIRYAFACGALALVFLLAVITAWRSYSPRSESAITPQTVVSVSADDAVLIAASETPRSWHDTWLDALAIVLSHIPQIVVAWLAGVLILTTRLAVSWSRARALAGRGAVAADSSWQRVAARLSDALGLRGVVRLVVSNGVDVPSVVGWLKPVVLLPVSTFSGLTPEQLEMVLAHELAHIRRHDFLVNAMQSVVETLLFYHPAVWWLSHQIRIERENCCDDLAVSVCGDAIQYARALAQLEELRAPTLALAANGGSLIERVRRLVGSHSDRSLFSSGWTAASAMASFLLLLVLTTAPMLAERHKKPAPQPPSSQIDVRPPQQPPQPAKAPRDHEQDAEPGDDSTPEPDVNVDDEPGMPPTPPVAVVPPTPAIAAMPHIAPVAIAEAVVAGLVNDNSDDQEQSQSSTPPGKLSVDELIALRVQGVTPEYIQQMRSIGMGDLSLRDIISMRTQGVTPDYVQKMRATGLGNLTAREIISMRVQGVSPEYVQQLRSAGVQIKSARDVVSLRVQGVTADFVRQLAAAGYDHLSVRDLARLAMAGVNSDFIREMSKYKK